MIRTALSVSLLAALAVSAQARNYAPQDECAELEGADDFRAALATAVAMRDREAVLQMAAEDITLDFGGGSGREELSRRLDSEPYYLWREFDALARLGCARSEGGRMIMPWHFAQDMGEIDPFEGYLVTGSRVALRSRPSLDSRVLARLSWIPVTVEPGVEPAGDFLAVRQPGGARGYMHSYYLRSFVDYRMVVERRDGRWAITTLVAGD